MGLNDHEQRIEILVSNRQTDKAVNEIKHYLLSNRKYAKSRIKAALWYRRLGYRTLALSVLKGEHEANIDLTSPSGEEQLILCRILNTLGSSHYALRMLNKMKTVGIPNRLLPTIGNIWLSNYCFDEALPFFEKAIATHEAPHSDTSHLSQISLADSLAGLKRFDQAISIAKSIGQQSQSNLIRFIASSALGEYLLKAGDHVAALKVLSELQSSVKSEDRSTDIGFWWKWFGVAQILNHHFELGLQSLEHAFRLLYDPKDKPEGWLEVVYWIGYAKFLINKNDFPTEWMRIVVYPTFNFPYATIIQDHCESEAWHLQQSSIHAVRYPQYLHDDLNNKKHILIDEIANVESENNKKKINLKMTSRLISLLLRSHEMQISRNRLIETLWPDELYSFQSLDLRLKNLIKESREKGVEIKSKDSCVQIEKSKKLTSVLYHPNITITGLDFLLEHQDRPFKRSDVEAHYGIAQAHAANIVKQWRNEDLISVDQLHHYVVTQKIISTNLKLNK